MDSNSTNHAEEEDIFAGLKKKSKKSSTTTTSSKEVEFDLDPTIAASTTPDSAAAAPATAAEVADEEDLDFSELKKMKKKKKKVVQLQLSSDDEQDSQPVRSRVDALGNEIIEPAVPLASTAEGGAATGTTTSKSDGSSSAPGAAADGTAATAAAGDGMDEFADLKKKKRKGGGKKSTFDLEAFEAELASSSSTAAAAAASSVEGTPAGSDGEENGDDEPVEGEDPFARNAGGAAEDGEAVLLSKAEQAAVDKDWLKEGQTERDYSYTELLGRFYSLLYASHPSLSATGTKKRYTLAPPSMHREGNKRSVFANVSDICKKMHRSPEHVIQFLFAELGTSGSVDGSGRLVIKGRFMQKQIENVLRRYIVEYVSCKTCKSPDTLLTKDNRLFFMTCESCGSSRSVSAIKSGFQAQTGKRKAVAKP